MSDTVIKVENLSKKFCRDLKRSLWYGLKDIGKEMLPLNKGDNLSLRKDEFWALDDINFELKRGEFLGLIGRNGAGKTTLLRLLNGLIKPDSGSIRIRGRIGALIALGAGFNPVLTGRENIYINGSVLGLSAKEIDRHLDEIIDFAEIDDFIDAPVQSYSSGMQVKLGFSIAAILLKPDILLLDEVLAVGDVGFQLKCFEKLGEMISNKNTSIIFISHNLHMISAFCTTLAVLDRGKLIHKGSIPGGLTIYKQKITELGSAGQIEKVKTGINGFRILKVVFSPPLQNGVLKLTSGQDIAFTIEYEASKPFEDVEVDVVIRLPIHTPTDYFQLTNKAVDARLDIKPGSGSLTVAVNGITLSNTKAHLYITVWDKNRKNILLWWRNIPIEFQGNTLSQGWSYFQSTFSNQQFL